MSIKHSWSGTVLIVESDSGISAADLKGDRGDTGPRGPQGPPGIVYDAEGNIIMEGYATKEYVSEEIAKAQSEDVDLSNYATKSYVDSKIRYGTGDLEAGSTYYPSGWLYVVYE